MLLFFTPPSHPDGETNLTSLPSPRNQSVQGVVPKRPTRTRRTPQYLEDFVFYKSTPQTLSLQGTKKRDRKRDSCAIRHYLLF